MATFQVTNTNDSGTGSLRAAITAANATGGPNTITFALPAGSTTIPVVSLANGGGGPLPAIASDLTIDGAGASGLMIDGQNANRVFFVLSGDVTIANLTIANSHATGGAGADGGGGGLGAGGAIFVNAGTTTISDVDFRNDGVTGGTGGGATRPAIANNVSNSGGGGGGGGLGGGGGGGSDGGGGGGGYSGGGGGASASGSFPGEIGGVGGAGPGGAGGKGGNQGEGGQAGVDGGPGGLGSDNSANGNASNGGGGGGGGIGGGRGGNSIIPPAPPSSGSGPGQPTEVGGAGAGGGGGGGLVAGSGGQGGSYDPLNAATGSSLPSAGGLGGGGGGADGETYTGGAGGDFGGGGGGGGAGGRGGFGGGGGAGNVNSQNGSSRDGSGYLGGVGGFGGGGGGGGATKFGGTALAPAAGGVGGGTGGQAVAGTSDFGAGGGGAAFGGAVFVRGGASLVIGTSGHYATFTGDGVTAGAGDMRSGNGAAAGSDLFLQTGTTTDLSAATGQVLALGGTIADDSAGSVPSGQGYTAGTAAGAALTIGTAGQNGRVVLSGPNTYAGGTTLAAGDLDLATAGAAGSGAITFGGSATQVAELSLQSAAQPIGGTFANTLNNFGVGDALDLRGFAFNNTLAYTVTNNTLTVRGGTGGIQTETFKLANGAPAYLARSDGFGGTLLTADGVSGQGTLDPPPAPVLGPGQDTGASATDRLTDIAAPTFTGTADPGATVSLYVDGSTTAAATGTADATTGQYSIELQAPLADGQHTVSASASEAGAYSSDISDPTTITVDTVPPSITSVTETGNGIGANGNGDVPAGTVVTFTVQTDGPVYVTPAADGSTPTLTFTNGGVATYTGPTGSATSQLTFSYTVQKGQDTTALQLSGITGSADVTDQAGNTIDLGSLMTASLPTGTLIVDTTPPIASSPTDTVAQNSGPTPIGIAAPSDNFTAAGSLAIAAGTLPTDGTVTLANGTPVVAGQALTAAQLTGLLFTPTPGVGNQGSTFTYTVTDGAGNATQGTAALNVGAAGAPIITGTHATTDQAEAPVAPFVGVTVTDPSSAAGATETLTIALTGGGGTLTGTGLTTVNGGYQLTGSAAQVTQQLDALSFTPTAGAPSTTTSTTFVLTDRSSAGTSVTDSGTSVADTAVTRVPVAPGSGGVVGVTPADTVSFSPLVSYEDGTFTLTGTASSASGVRSVEITAVVDGAATDLGAATVDANGNFTFKDVVGPGLQGFITATETNGAGGTAAAQANFSLQGGLDRPNPGRAPFVAEQDVYNADGSAVTSTSLFRDDGSPSNDASRRTTIMAPGQTFVSDQFDDFKNGGAPETTFVFNPNHGLDTIGLFRPDNADHDTLSFSAADYGNSIANVLNDTRQTKGGSSIIADPVTGDTVKLVGVTKQTLTTYAQQDITFHA